MSTINTIYNIFYYFTFIFYIETSFKQFTRGKFLLTNKLIYIKIFDAFGKNQLYTCIYLPYYQKQKLIVIFLVIETDSDTQSPLRVVFRMH